ncbi:MAG: tyrosine-type recombinase/integrase [Alphaproteobacteria bacterium]|jgi:integrase|nr:tyrosine-type recombinase/integrase [Alphaproteobacteria bacterium]MBT6386165.1 tyrosine-type recombinase/integrase [Alphaproteobacteria bacterium]
MRNISDAKHIICRDGVFYYVRRVPADIAALYSKERFYFSLRTKSRAIACRAASSVSQKLEAYWMGIRLEQLDIPELVAASGVKLHSSDLPTLNDAKELYIQLKGTGKGKTFFQAAERSVRYVSKALGDRTLDQYSSQDAAMFRDWLIAKGLSVVSVKRNFSTIRSIVNLCIRENGLTCRNAFSATYMPQHEERAKRQPIPVENINTIQNSCYEIDDDLRHIVALISDTGMRLAETVGLKLSDIHLDVDVPHVMVQPHPHRHLKTADSERAIPLTGASLWAAKRVVATSASSEFAFPRYSKKGECYSNSASATLNKWIKPFVPINCVLHSFRHSIRDRLRAIECPADVIDAIGGWATAGVGHNYGSGHPLAVKHHWLDQIAKGTSTAPHAS